MENLHQVINSIQIRKLLWEQEPSTPVIRQVVASGVLAIFVECLQKDDVTMRIEALKICVDITHWIRSERAELAGECPFEALAEAGAYPHLIGLIGSRNDCLVEISAAAIGNIATFCPRHRDLLLKAGVMAPLVNLFNRFWTLSNVSMTRHVVKALANMSHPEPPELDTSVQPQVAVYSFLRMKMCYIIRVGHCVTARSKSWINLSTVSYVTVLSSSYHTTLLAP